MKSFTRNPSNAPESCGYRVRRALVVAHSAASTKVAPIKIVGSCSIQGTVRVRNEDTFDTKVRFVAQMSNYTLVGRECFACFKRSSSPKQKYSK